MVIAFLKSIIPAQSYDLIADYVTYVLSHQSSGLFLAGLIMSITASSAAFRSLLSISAEIYGRRTFRGSGICSPPCSSPCCCWRWCTPP